MTRRWWRRLRAVLACAVVATAAVAPTARAADVTLATGAFAKFSHKNGLGSIPESNVVYRFAPFAATGSVRTVVRGRVPRARLWAFSLYESSVRPIDVLTDRDIHVSRGRFTITVRRGCGRTPNCLDAAKADNAALSRGALLVYRLYDAADLGRAESGGVSLPTVTYVGDGPEAKLDASALTLPVENTAVEDVVAHAVDLVRDLLAGNGPGLGPVAVPDNSPPPTVAPFRDTKDAYLQWLGERGAPAPVTDAVRQAFRSAAARNFGILDGQFRGVNTYEGTTYDLRRGNLELRFRAPTYRRSSWDGRPRNGLARTNGREALRYWSVCAYKAHLQESGCLHDAQLSVGADRTAVVVVAPRCPVAGYVNCLPAGTETVPDFVVVLRNTLPAPGFADREFKGRYAVAARYVARPAEGSP